MAPSFWVLAVSSCLIVAQSQLVTLYVDTSLRCDLSPQQPNYYTVPNFQCIPDPFDVTSSMMVNCSSNKGSSPWTFTRFNGSTTCQSTATITKWTDTGSGCLQLGKVGFRVDCTGLPATTGVMCRQSDLDGCKVYTSQTACRQQGYDYPCDWCVADQRCYYRPPLQPCYQEKDGSTTQYLPGIGVCPVGSICNVTDSVKCLIKTPGNCGVSNALKCGMCSNPTAPTTQICALNPPKACNYLGVANTFPNYCPGITPPYPPCADNEMHEATAWCANKESAEECNFSDDNVWPCKWCSTLGGAPRCMWTPAMSCSYYEPTYGITIIYGGVSADHTGGDCAVIGGAISSFVSVWSIILIILSCLLFGT